MAEETLQTYIKQLLEYNKLPEVTIAWQGGEPTQMGVDFFRRADEYVKKYRKFGVNVAYAIQTNGTLLNPEWCKFFREHSYLVGISLDGPKNLHDAYRVDKKGKGTFEQVMRGLRLLQKYKVEYNILCTVNAANADYPLDVYRFFRDEVNAEFIQFIPVVERNNETGFQEGNRVSDRSVKPKQWGEFLSSVFDEWVRHDVGKVFVQQFDAALAAWLNYPATLCVFAPTCGTALVLEHTGDLYSCDHFVEPDYYLGNITETPLIELVTSQKQLKFGRDKEKMLPGYCRKCQVHFACRGGCPKDRFIETPEGDQGLNYLCEGYNLFFTYIDRPMKMMANLLRQNRYADEIMPVLAAEERMSGSIGKTGSRNKPCTCGSGLKYKKCCGKRG